MTDDVDMTKAEFPKKILPLKPSSGLMRRHHAFVAIMLADSYTLWAVALSSFRFRNRLVPSWKTRASTITTTQIFGLDYEAMNEDEECDLFIRPMSIPGLDISNRTAMESMTPTMSKCYQLDYPNPSILPEDVVNICMRALQYNNEPFLNAGLEVNFNFSSDRCRSALGGNLHNFISYARNPTFGSMVNCRSWTIVSVGPEIPGTQVRGPMKTVLVSVSPSSDKLPGRHFLWTVQKERRPPRQGCWLVHECILVDNAYDMTL